MAEETRRFSGSDSSELLPFSSIKNNDVVQVRHDPNGTNDSDKGIIIANLRGGYVGKCETASETQNKTITVENAPDFQLVDGVEVLVYFANGNTATSPNFNVATTGNIAAALENQASNVNIGSGCWGAGVFLTLKYVDLTVSGTRIQKWIIKGHNVAEQTTDYTKMADGRYIYSNSQNKIYVQRTVITDLCQYPITSGRVQYSVKSGVCYLQFINVIFADDIPSWSNLFPDGTIPSTINGQGYFTLDRYSSGVAQDELKMTTISGRIQNSNAISKNTELSGNIAFIIS